MDITAKLNEMRALAAMARRMAARPDAEPRWQRQADFLEGCIAAGEQGGLKGYTTFVKSRIGTR